MFLACVLAATIFTAEDRKTGDMYLKLGMALVLTSNSAPNLFRQHGPKNFGAGYLGIIHSYLLLKANMASQSTLKVEATGDFTGIMLDQ